MGPTRALKGVLVILTAGGKRVCIPERLDVRVAERASARLQRLAVALPYSGMGGRTTASRRHATPTGANAGRSHVPSVRILREGISHERS